MRKFFSDFWLHYEWLFRAICVSLLISFVLIILGELLKRKIVPFFSKHFKKSKNSIFAMVLKGFSKPIGFYFLCLGIYSGLHYFLSVVPITAPTFLFNISEKLPAVLEIAIRLVTIFCVAWGLVRSSNAYVLLLNTAREKLNIKITKNLIHFISAIFNVVVIALAVVMILTELGYDVSALITALGLGGLTIALAAKDSAANFFGGLILVTEGSFEIGDWISCNEVEGTVEDINLRSTKIRTAPGSLTTVPNSTLSNSDITNWSSGMEQRQTKFKIFLQYNIPERNLKEYIAAIRTMLETHDGIQTSSVQVNLTDLTETCMNITIAYYIVIPDYNNFLKIKEEVNYSLIELAEKNNILFMNPSKIFTDGIKVIS